MSAAAGKHIREVGDEMPERITKVEAKDGNTLVFVVDGVRRHVNLTGLIAKSEHFSRFAADKAAFKRVRPTKWGYGIVWDNGLDLSRDTLVRMSEEQEPMTGKQFAKHLYELKLNYPEAARILDTTERTIRGYVVREHVPNTTAYTIRRCAEDINFFMALYRPVPVAPRGRPKAVAKH